jgi:hypothetical protein
MSVSPVSQAHAAAGEHPIQNRTQQKPQPPAAPQDTVQLSPQAKAALGDVNHDGDSH